MKSSILELLSLVNYDIRMSVLCNLEPIGLDTPLVEGLTSYISRISESHSLLVQDLLLHGIIPYYSHSNNIEKDYSTVKYLMHDSFHMNGLLSVAKDWSSKIEDLTGRDDLHRLTMLYWWETISFVEIQCRERRWCPKCYENWRMSNNIIYDPLIWTIYPMKVCVRHQTPLASICPNCGRGSPPLAPRLRPGYCALCNTWLGSLQPRVSEYESAVDADDRIWQEFVWHSVSSLLSFRPNLELPPCKNNIPLAISMYDALAGHGGIAWLAAQIKGTRPPLMSIWKYHSIPRLITILRLCAFFHLSIVDILTSKHLEDIIKENIESGLITKPPKKVFIRNELKEEEMQFIRREMTLYCEMSQPPSLYKIARQLAYAPQTLQKYAPEQAKILMKRIDFNGRSEYLRLEILKASSEEPPPPQNQVVERLRMTKKERKLFIDELKAIAARYMGYRNKLKEERLRESISRIQEATKALYDEGTFPSRERVCEQLGWKPATLKHILLRQAWEDTLSELQRSFSPRMATDQC